MGLSQHRKTVFCLKSAEWKQCLNRILNACRRIAFLYLSIRCKSCESKNRHHAASKQMWIKTRPRTTRSRLRAPSYRKKSSHGDDQGYSRRLGYVERQEDACRLPRSERSYLRDVHHSITAERSGRGQVIEAQKCRDDTILINPANHGPIHKKDYAVLIHRNACRERGK